MRLPLADVTLPGLLTAGSRAANTLAGAAWSRQRGLLEGTLRYAALGAWTWERILEGLVLPAWTAVAEVDRDVLRAFGEAWGRGLTAWAGVADPAARRDGAAAGARAAEASPPLDDRLVAALRYRHLVLTMGRALFGSARWQDEARLDEDADFRLTYVPPAAGVAPAPIALFHVGGVLPYGDPLFRLLPEANWYDRFRERGIGVYAMELKGDRHAHDHRAMTLGDVIGSISRLSARAEAHARARAGAGGRRLVLEGYCALAPHVVAYAAARAEEAAARFALATLFVGPVDGTRCATLAESVRLVPDELLALSYATSELVHGYVSGDDVRLSQDLALKALFLKTPLGYFATGWKQPALARALALDDLSPEARRALAGAYWISPENGRRFPVPLELSRFSGALFRQGIAEDGTLPFRIEGRPIGLRAIADAGLPVVGFYGGKDVLVPDATAEPLRRVLGPAGLYTHVVHPGAGHVTYVLSPRVWRPGPGALDPNPIDLILEQASRRG